MSSPPDNPTRRFLIAPIDPRPHTAGMVRYRRNRVPGATYFFTVTLANRSSRLLVEAIAQLRNAYAAALRQRPATTVASVVMPDHLHAIWRLPQGDCDYSGRWRAIKSGFVRNLRHSGTLPSTTQRVEAVIWQRRFWEHTIRSEADLRAHIDYVHWNPVKHGYVTRVRDWPHSSFHRHVRDGTLDVNWGGEMQETPGNFGERR